MSSMTQAVAAPTGLEVESTGFSLVRGGPLYALQRAVGLTTAPNDGAIQRGLLLAAIAWLPLVALAFVDGVAVGAPGPASLLTDYAAWARFAIAVPLFVAVEPIADRWVAVTTQYLVTSGIVGEAARPAFDAALERAGRRRDSWRNELVILVLAYAVANASAGVRAAVPEATWLHGVRGGPGLSYTALWYAGVSLPLFNFLLLRWFWRLTLWTLLVRRTSKLDLRLVPGHPDRAAGLGVLGEVPPAFALLAFGIGTVFAGGLANWVIVGEISVQFVAAVAVAHLTLSVLIFVAPIVGFWRLLRRERLRALVEYGVLGSELVRQFEGRWLRPGSGREDEALSAPDFSALTDFNQLVDVVREMKFVPIGRAGLIRLAAAALCPFLPVVAMIVPVRDLADAMIGLVF